MGLFKNEVGRPSNETIKKKNIFKVICFVLVLIIIGLVSYILSDKGIINIDNNKFNNGDKKITTTAKVEEKNKEVLDVNSEEVVNLFMKYNLFSCFIDAIMEERKEFSYFYQKELLLNKDISDSIKFIYSVGNLYYPKDESIYRLLNLSDGESINIDIINKKSRELFGSDIDFSKIKLNAYGNHIMGYSFNYDEKEKHVLAYNSPIGEVSSVDKQTKIIDSYKLENKLIIKNKLMYTYTGPDLLDNEFLILKKFNDINNMKKYVIDKASSDKTIDDYLDKLDTFKWTFVKGEDGNYTFQSVEKVK